MKALTNYFPFNITQKEQLLLEKDQWNIAELGYDAHKPYPHRSLSFHRFKQSWFKIAVKKYVLYQSTTKCPSSCQAYLTGLGHFSDFLSQLNELISPEQVNRELITHYLQYLFNSHLSTPSRQLAIIHFRTFHQVCVEAQWLPWPLTPLVYTADIPRLIETLPDFIPDSVMQQLQIALPSIKPHIRHVIALLIETGRRLGEILGLSADCLEKDNEKDWYLRIKEPKFRQERLIPLSNKAVEIIHDQQKLLLTKKDKTSGYLFPSKHYNSQSPTLTYSYINAVLKKMAKQFHIVDENNQLWNFHSHQFRHTIATKMINQGVSISVIQCHTTFFRSSVATHDRTICPYT